MAASTHDESSVRVVAITTIGALLQIHGALKESEVNETAKVFAFL